MLGPDKLASMAKDFGGSRGELKDAAQGLRRTEEGEAAKAARVLESGEKEEVGLGATRQVA